MEATLSVIGVFGGLGFMLIVLVYAWMFFNWVWLTPKNTEKSLRDQGLKGTSYKFLYGDVKEIVKMITEASLKPINLTDDILPRVLSFAHNAVTTHGKNCFTWAGPKPILHITDPTMIREMFGKYEDFQKAKGSNPLLTLLAKGLVLVEGDQWVKHRKIINPAFHVEKLKHMVPAFYVSCDEMIKKWEDTLKEESSCEMDVWPHLTTMTSDVISRTAFGSSFVEGKKIFELQRELAELIITASRSIYIPGSQFLPTKSNKRIKAIAQEVKGLVRGIIDKRVTEMKSGKCSNDDLLGILLDSNYKEIKQHGNNKFGLSIDDVIEECKLFYFAGQETTATLLVWTMILLAQHKNWQDHARDEALKVFGEKKPAINVLSDMLSQLKIINSVFLEVLRLYPPVVAMTRMIHKETKLGDINLPAGSLIQLHTMLSHYDPNIWGDDVKEFNPERFYEGVSKVTKGQSVYFPFGGGPRVCIGQNFAMLEAKLALAMILSRFSFELSPSYSHAPRPIVTLQPQFGAHLILHKLT
ncbi:cytochrome P450 CYP72A219 [Lactuca sativa]|uniref:cytochrome P450 CYP72A219 n=1 Tax=Lactuca sativa TaxID=4236 RepID=UPI000CA9D8D9|nr:cytochrome P450 CYP72A219 [Lactuca sativa]